MLKNNFFFKIENETEFKMDMEYSSLFRPVVIVKRKKNLEEKTAKEYVFIGETPKVEQEEITDFDKLLVERKVHSEKIKLDNLIDELTKKLVVSLKYFSIDDAEISQAERLALDIEREYSSRVLGEILQNIYIQYNDYSNMLLGLCKIIGRFELEEVMPWGPTMLVGLLSHKNETVKEYAVAVVENWADIDMLPILRNLDCSSKWLKEYIEDVVNYLEGYNAIHKKIV